MRREQSPKSGSLAPDPNLKPMPGRHGMYKYVGSILDVSELITKKRIEKGLIKEKRQK
jgi:hypothetical protein